MSPAQRDAARHLEAATNGEIDVLLDPTPADLERLDDWSEIGWLLHENGAIFRIGGPFDPRR